MKYEGTKFFGQCINISKKAKINLFKAAFESFSPKTKLPKRNQEQPIPIDVTNDFKSQGYQR